MSITAVVMSNPFSNKHADNASAQSNSPVPDAMTEPIDWNNRDLVYLLSLLKPEEVVADALIFNPPLEALEELTYPFHLQIYKKAAPIEIEAYPYSKDALIGANGPQPRMVIAESDRGCLSPKLACRSVAHDLLSDNKLLGAIIARYNILWAIHTTDMATLKSIFRAMCEMITIADDEWLERLDQLCGIVAGNYTGQCVDGNCSVDTRLEYYFLMTGRIALQDWIRCVGACSSMDSDEERAVHAKIYGKAGSFLGRVFDEKTG